MFFVQTLNLGLRPKKKENLISHDMIVGSFIPSMYSMRTFDIGMSRL